eukprot:9037286-Alexandrium_andersonii.AAC.1
MSASLVGSEMCIRDRSSHPADHLRHMLVRLAACVGCTTSGVEHQHAQQDRILSGLKSCRECVEVDRLKLAVDYDPSESSRAVGLAIKLWQSNYGKVRKRDVKRIDSGIGRPQTRGKTLAAFIRRRRSNIQDAVASS